MSEPDATFVGDRVTRLLWCTWNDGYSLCREPDRDVHDCLYCQTRDMEEEEAWNHFVGGSDPQTRPWCRYRSEQEVSLLEMSDALRRNFQNIAIQTNK
jgi:hypothetical protein